MGCDIVRDDRKPGMPATLVVGLHGFGADETQIAGLLPLTEVTRPILYVAPRAPWYVVGGGYGWFPITGTAPTDIEDSDLDLEMAVRELREVISALRSFSGLDAGKVWLVGYSQGAPMALHTLIADPGRIGGCAVGAGHLLRQRDPETNLAGTQVMLSVSTRDPFVSASEYDRTRDTLAALGAEVTLEREVAPHVISASQATGIATWLQEQISVQTQTSKS